MIIAGLLLLLLELIVPGGIVGTIGGITTIVGIVLMYNHYGNLYGNIALLVSLIVCAVGLYFFFRDKTWKRLALNDSIDVKLKIKKKWIVS
jgi:membrane-bound serine protease (ClpP class)